MTTLSKSAIRLAVLLLLAGQARAGLANMVISSFNTNEVMIYDLTPGSIVKPFVAAGSGGLDGPQGLAFGSDGNLYVASQHSNSVLKVDGGTGGFIRPFVT